MRHKSKFKTVFKPIMMDESTKGLLAEISKVLGKSQAQILREFIKAIAQPVAMYNRGCGSLLYSDEDSRSGDDPYQIIIKISGSSRRLESGMHPPTRADLIRDKG